MKYSCDVVFLKCDGQELQNCFQQGMFYDKPRLLPATERTIELSAELCQERCQGLVPDISRSGHQKYPKVLWMNGNIFQSEPQISSKANHSQNNTFTDTERERERENE